MGWRAERTRAQAGDYRTSVGVNGQVTDLCWCADWACWGAWSHGIREAALAPVAGLHRYGRRTDWLTSRGLQSGWVPGTSCSTPLVAYSPSVLKFKYTHINQLNYASYKLYLFQYQLLHWHVFLMVKCFKNVLIDSLTNMPLENIYIVNTVSIYIYFHYIFDLYCAVSKASYLAILYCNWINCPCWAQCFGN